MMTMELAVGSKSSPFLADHGFQDMVVLPGSFYVGETIRIYLEQCQRAPCQIREVRFITPAIISEKDLRIRVAARKTPEGFEFEFFQIEPDGQPAPLLATLKVCGESQPTGDERLADFSIEAFQDRNGPPLHATEFYDRLRQNGNQYGPGFQIIKEIWRGDGQGMGLLSKGAQEQEAGLPLLDSASLDACTQLLSALVLENGRTFVLKSMAALRIHDLHLPATFWALAELRTPADEEGNGFVGDIRVFDEKGKLYLHFSGVNFAYLDAVQERKKETASVHLCVASTFTAEPLEDSLQFWSAQLRMPVHVEFAPYNQVFQEFLDPGSLFHKNRDGVNVVLLNLEDWRQIDAKSGLGFDRERAERCFQNQPRYVLPNGLEIVHLNRHETDYVFKEIFKDKSYLKHGIRLQDGDTVIDIGANIGLFSLFVASSCHDPTIYAFEPSPAAFERLKANGETYIPNFHAFNCGVSDRHKTASFTFYEKSSVFSSFYSDETEDRAAIQAVVRNMLGAEVAGGPAVEADVQALTSDRLRSTIHECPLWSVSDIIRENGIEKIDLLKIDAEKSELEILAGIAERDWAIIQQIVIEIHDQTGLVADRVERLLAEKGFRCAVEQEKLLEHSGLFNIYATRGEVQESDRSANVRTSLTRNKDEFCTALSSFMDQSGGPVILCIAPRTRLVDETSVLFEEIEQELLERAGQIQNVQTISSKFILDRYPVENFHDAQSHQLGHIPYSPEGYAAIGTALFRRLFHWKSRPFKVVVLDCDNTLWRGECGEDGPLGVKVTEAHRSLQEFILGQMNAGLLLCLCSRNNEEDVLQVFDQRTDMPLRREHLAAWRINWKRKSDNLQSLAEELGLGLDGFIFIDDNPVECAEVKAACPAVLTLTLPREEKAISPFLHHVWAFDHTTLTDEDRKRTSFHHENAPRQKFREQFLSLKDFIDGLELTIQIRPFAADQLARVSQLTYRTNQFNLTTIRRSEDEITALLKDENVRCWTASVSDRFGDYGLVSVLLYRVEKKQWVVDTFLLSCRALGRGVEHHLLSELGRQAKAEGVEWIEITCCPTEKNRPALDFITNLGQGYQTEAASELTFRFPAEMLTTLRYNPDFVAPSKTSPRERTKAQPVALTRAGADSNRLQEIAEELADISRISHAILQSKLSNIPLPAAAYAAAGNNLEGALVNIWKKVLGRAQIGINDNFFDAGGTSLKAVLVVAAVRRELKEALSIVTLFECPTIKLLAARLNQILDEPGLKAETSGAELRGQMRRSRVIKRRSR